MPPKKLPNLLKFVPEQWGEVARFANFYSGTHNFTSHETRFVGGVAAHFNKAITLHALAIDLRPTLAQDRLELEEQGYSHATNSGKLSAVIEAAILELYSTVDCAAKVIIAIYGKNSRGLKDSTRRLFSSFETVSGGFPEDLKVVLRTATWYEELRMYRDELTHGQTGSCSLDRVSDQVSYMHHGIVRDGRALIIDDIFSWIEAMRNEVNQFLGPLFQYLNHQLGPSPIQTVCGFTEGRLLMRTVDPSQLPITFNSGHCMSFHWFQQPDNPGCPFSSDCGAYKRTLAEVGASTDVK